MSGTQKIINQKDQAHFVDRQVCCTRPLVSLRILYTLFDFGIPMEAGYEFKNNLGVGVRVTPGITNINSSDYESSHKDHNFTVTLKATYTFKF